MCARLKAELENVRSRRDATVSSMQSSHNDELRRLRDELTDSESTWRAQIERLKTENSEQIEDLRREMRDLKERSDTARSKVEREKNSLESELAKVNCSFGVK